MSDADELGTGQIERHPDRPTVTLLGKWEPAKTI